MPGKCHLRNLPWGFLPDELMFFLKNAIAYVVVACEGLIVVLEKWL